MAIARRNADATSRGGWWRARGTPTRADWVPARPGEGPGDQGEPHMPSIRRRLARSSRALLPLLLLGALGAPAAAEADSAYAMDLYFRAGYERQVDERTCIAASTAMMLNFIARRDLGLGQRSILRFAQANDALDDEVQRGSDPLGWSAALTAYSAAIAPVTYEWRAFDSELEALRYAAYAMASTGKPVGLTVTKGRHAVVMTGFEASKNPARAPSWTLRAVYVSDPYGARRARFAPADTSPLNRYRELDATPEHAAAGYGKFVIVVPTW